MKVGTFAIGYCPTPSGPEGSSGKQTSGVPETFLVDRSGTILYKFVGPLSPKRLEESLMPELEAALAAEE